MSDPCRSCDPSLDEQVEALGRRPKEEDMALQQTFVGRTKSIAGAALIGLGILVFYKNLHQAATQLSHLLGVIPSEAPGGPSHRHHGCLSSFAGIRRRSPSTSA